MLVLSRRSGEEVLVPQHGIVLTILEIHGDTVRVGVSAPLAVKVYRREVWERMRHDSDPDAGAYPQADLIRPGVETLDRDSP